MQNFKPNWEAQNYKIGILGSERCKLRHEEPHGKVVQIGWLQEGATVVTESIF